MNPVTIDSIPPSLAKLERWIQVEAPSLHRTANAWPLPTYYSNGRRRNPGDAGGPFDMARLVDAETALAAVGAHNEANRWGKRRALCVCLLAHPRTPLYSVVRVTGALDPWGALREDVADVLRGAWAFRGNERGSVVGIVQGSIRECVVLPDDSRAWTVQTASNARRNLSVIVGGPTLPGFDGRNSMMPCDALTSMLQGEVGPDGVLIRARTAT